MPLVGQVTVNASRYPKPKSSAVRISPDWKSPNEGALVERSLTVLLPVHNHQSVLAARVQRILDVLPELTRHFELIIVDDGSTDATIEVADELASQYPQVQAVRHEIPLGRLAALQSGLARSHGDVILLYDEDSGLSMQEVQQRWKAMSGVSRGVKRTEPRHGSPTRPLLWSDSFGEEGYQMLDRRAMKLILDQADSTTDGQPTSTGPSRPRRPNYMARLRAFAIGE